MANQQFERTDRIASEIMRETEKIIREDVSDPRTDCMFSITHVDVTRDLRYAKVYVSVYEEEKRAPMMKALKRDGQKLCDLARQGIDVKVEPRPTQVYAIQVLHENADGSFMLQIRCGRGTYIRTLCHDIGEALGTKAHMGMLLRAQTGMFTLDDAHTIEEIDAADELSPLLTAMDQPLGHLPRLDVQPKAERFVRNGNRLTRRELIGDVQPGQPTRLYLNGQFCGIGRFDGETLKFDAMLLE